MARPFGNCDSYFVVDGNERGEMMRKEAAKVTENRQKKLRQEAMAQELTQIAKEEYGADIIRHMEEQEVRSLLIRRSFQG